MKLKEQEHDLRKAKEEEHKLAVDDMDTSMSDTNNLDLTIIKQEDTREKGMLLQQDAGKSMGDMMDEEEYRYSCNVCNSRMPDLKSVLEHRLSVHVDKRGSSTRIKNVELEPDVHDPKFYCVSCEKSYKDVNRYRRHLKVSHFMVFKPKSRWKEPQNGPLPDPNDPDVYCPACDRTYKCRSNYKAHCRYAHGVTSSSSVNKRSKSKSTPVSIMSTYCQTCDKRLASKTSYHRHLLMVHKVHERSAQRSDILPDVDDPNYYCRACDKNLAEKWSYKEHLMSKHAIFQPIQRKRKSTNSLKQDVDDPNNHCRACQKTYHPKSRYRKHLRMVHRMTIPLLKGNHKGGELPDPYNPDYHCSVVHVMDLSQPPIVNPVA
ncbi:C2H2-type zinc finger transcription factor [Mucor lusitanicus CBS 277.49]|uniref:C2H2-type zinc finger transcription factor n=1 Tax=Mucor lusitanicus CBS 277.49 TaxID=747725 RepID=A0A162THT8_MUCCL|nr:C2H2-type zinc finger transcription factor [Mucor lusitanicus CBS 277.49]